MESPDKLKGNIGKLSKEVGKGYLLEVEISYLHDLHDLCHDLPFMCERKKISRVQKLVPNLYDKKKYVIHIAAFDQALKHGLVLLRIHPTIEFNQSAWLAPYTEFNIQLRTKAKNDFQKDFFKLINNSVFGKMIENIRKHRDINLVTNQEVYLKKLKSQIVFSENLTGCKMGMIRVIMNKPIYFEVYLKKVMKLKLKSQIVFSENLTGCKMGMIRVIMNKPIYFGQAILNMSKTIMYELHYDYMKLKYGVNLWLCYMDTNSLVYDIKTDNFYENIASNVKTRFDTSGYSCSGGPSSPHGSEQEGNWPHEGQTGWKDHN